MLGSCTTTCARSLYRDPVGSLYRDPVGPLYQDPIGQLVQDLCEDPLDHLNQDPAGAFVYKIPVMRTLAQDLFIRIL